MTFLSAMTPDDRKTIDLQEKINTCREVKAKLRKRAQETKEEIGPMRATIKRDKAEIADKAAEIQALHIE
jgi:hypothetical protein